MKTTEQKARKISQKLIGHPQSLSTEISGFCSRVY